MRSTLASRRFAVELLEDRTTPATFTVTNLNDAGTGSLRDAIGLANAMPGADMIRFDSSLAGQTLGLTTIGDVSIGQSALFVTTPVTITGSGQTIIRQGAIPFRLFAVSTTGTLSLQNLTLMNGFARGGDGALGGGGAAGFGGAVYNQGVLSISGTTLTENQAVGGSGASGGASGGGGGLAGPASGSSGGPPNGGVLGGNSKGGNGGFGGGGSSSLSESVTGGNGGFGGGGGAGAVGGSAGFGGGGGGGGLSTGGGSPGGYGGRGVGSSGGAAADGAGGGGSGVGGAIFNQGGAVTITNSTIAGNAARGGNSAGKGQNGGGFGGGVFNLNGSVTFNNATVAGNTVVTGTGGVANTANGGALYNASVNVGGDTINQTATAIISNSILSHTSIIGSAVSNFQDAASTGMALLDRTGPSILIGSLETNGSTSGSYITADPNLGPLQDNGGFTQTMLPSAGSSAIDKGGNTSVTGLTTDQRGGNFARISNGIVDIGAVEVQLAPAPVVIAPTSLPAGQVGTAYNQTITASGPAGPFTLAVTSGSLPAGLTLNSSGLLSGTPTTAAAASFTVTATNGASATGSRAYTMNVTLPGTPKPGLVGYKQFAVGTDTGIGNVTIYNADGTLRFTLTPFPSQAGGVRTAAADFNGDGVADLVVGTGPGGATHVKVFDGATQAELFAIDPFEASFKGGVYVAAGDIDGDGRAELAITPDEGGGPRVRVFSGNGFVQIADFFGIDDPNFRGGARAAIGDLNGDGKGDLVVAAGFGGGPRVAAFNGAQLGNNGGPKLFGDFFAFEATLRNGIFVAAGDVNGDGFADIVAGGGPGGGPRVFAIDGNALVTNGSNTLVQDANYFAGNPNNRGGVRVSVKNLDGDAKADVVTGAGTGAGSTVTAYLGANTTPFGGTPVATLNFDAFAGFAAGVFVG